MRSLAVLQVSSEIRPSKMLNVVSKQKDTVDGWVKSIQGQLSRFLDFENGENKAVMVNNYDWFGSISFIDFLRDIGKYFTVNYMMSKESVKKRMKQEFHTLSLLTKSCKGTTSSSLTKTTT